MKNANNLPLLAAGVVALAVQLQAANWPQWRGPEFNGSSPERNLPAQWSKTENVKWVADLPGVSAATPAVWDNHVFVTAAVRERQELLAIAVDRRTGKILWQQKVSDGFGQDNRSTYASPSPVTDGKTVWFFFGNGELAAFDFNGKKLWARNIQRDYGAFAFLWTFSSSPLLYNGRLYLQVLQRDVPVNGRGRRDGPNESYLLAMDPATGKELWRHIRPSDAREESREAFSTPIPHTHAGRAEILIAGGDCISGHDPATGREFWRWGTWNPQRITHWRLVPSPVAAQGVVLACAPKGGPVVAVKLGRNGVLSDKEVAWQSEDRAVSTDVSTPLYYQGRFYVLNSDRRTLSCLEPLSGKVLWTGELKGRSKIEASPTGADGKIYVMNHSGEVFVVAAGDTFNLLATIPMGGEAEDRDLRSTIVPAYGNLFIRTGAKLYCIGK
ncbi:PQQ-binding-like beta-propeller repeat protein [Fontisphaera persica]|uniref:outer membrane protein assembly factor BamB family protein n=1 Tax=Fontisphaera persica TaxID=2974023 RepID=UPI0024BFF07D|nr:PQQ-binding-like beta-propeller repeat protein [Fontisphaera persica]WCJ59715.1 PQQ-binding-like beta-propeller repeat protein [Fontisphaera persica]